MLFLQQEWLPYLAYLLDYFLHYCFLLVWQSMPKSAGYSFLDQGSLADQIEKGEKREALFMGLGDLVIPGALVVSSKASLGWMVGISSMIGGLIGFCILMVFVLSGRPQAGLPLLNGGAILGYVVGAFVFVGNLGL